MIANITVITDNLDYLLWGRVAEGQPGGVLLTVLMAIGAAILALPGGIILACCAWRFPGAVRNVLFIWAEFIRGIPLIFVIFLDVVFAPHDDRKRSPWCRYRDAGVGMVYRRLGDALGVCRN